MRRSTVPSRFLSPEEMAAVRAQIAAAERATTAEFKVVLAKYCWSGLFRKGRAVFRRFGLADTENHNGVLLLLVTTDRRFLVFGDDGIHQHAGPAFWEEVRNLMLDHFARDAMGEGLCAGIRRIGEKLAEQYPAAGSANTDEVSNDIEFVW